MFSYISGILTQIGTNYAVVDVGGIGFKMVTSLNTLRCLPDCDERVTLFTYLSVREDALELFGFYMESELDSFKLLISVTGVGPRVALSILSELTPEQFALAVATKDVKALTCAAGVGVKLAQRIILELTDRIGAELVVVCDNNPNVNSHSALHFGDGADDAVAALVVLGYSNVDATRVIRSLDLEGLTVEEMVREGLKRLQ